MLTEVMQHYGLTRDPHTAGYFETEHHQRICKDIRSAIVDGNLVAIAGMVGSGKTALLQHITTVRSNAKQIQLVIVSDVFGIVGRL